MQKKTILDAGQCQGVFGIFFIRDTLKHRQRVQTLFAGHAQQQFDFTGGRSKTVGFVFLKMLRSFEVTGFRKCLIVHARCR